jgi:enoyl-CoA hydratase/carnithine racemase
MSESVDMRVDDGVATVLINRPEVRNAIDKPTADAIAAALDEADSRDDVAVIVLSGAGGVFSAGMDLKAFSKSGERPLTSRGAFGIVESPPMKPVIAAVEGKALGGGFEIALACDLIVAAADAVFGLPEVRRGLVAAAGGVLRLPRRLPRNLAMEMVLTGAQMTALDAQRHGLVNRVAPPGQTLNEARVMAAEIAAGAPFAVRTAKQLIDASSDWASTELFERQAPYTDAVGRSADAVEGARAFVEKRLPVWSGK